MAIYRMQCAFQYDSEFARDAMVITPHFRDNGATSDPQGLAQDLADALSGWQGGTAPVHVKCYDAEGTPPVFPNGDATAGGATAISASVPREVAICLSYYAERNLPRQRGRLYIPLAVMNSGSAALRPSSTQITKVAALVPIFTGLGGTDVDWVVWSRTLKQEMSVTDWWIDDEWDTVRSRGLRATTRTTGTTEEA